jgi:two-component system chemotaxis response regulator CheB
MERFLQITLPLWVNGSTSIPVAIKKSIKTKLSRPAKQGSNGKANHLLPIVVIGTSAGGLAALARLVAQFTKQDNFAVFIVIHLSQESIGAYLVNHLQAKTAFTCKLAEKGDAIHAQTIYIAPPNHHLLIKPGEIMLGHGPKENRWRPSIDVMFRSAAVAYGHWVTGVVLTGLLDDGTSGMWAIKESGGTCVVQQPEDAEYPDMPNSVLRNMEVDYIVSLDEMGAAIRTAAQKRRTSKIQVPRHVVAEAKIAENMAISVNDVSALGEQTIFTCPDCGGNLWEITENNLRRYRCYTGHVYTQQELLAQQSESQENSLWVAVRIMEERKNLLLRIVEKNKTHGWKKAAGAYQKKADDVAFHIQRMREILFDGEPLGK